MVDLQVITNTGTNTLLAEATVEEFQTSLRGPLLQPGDAGYDDARIVWNGMIDRRPALIARCAGVADVIQAVNFARDNHLLVSVRGGGHNITGNAVNDGGMVIDLSQMKGVRIDMAKRTARGEAGLTWGEYFHEIQAFGLASTGGVVSTTGISGLSLGGGLGWLMGKHGLTCDCLLSADMVTADGRFVTASATENSDLFWGLRGGGGNFGVVTSFEFQLYPVGPTVLGGMVIYPMAQAKEVLRFYREYARSCPDELTAWAALMTSPEGDPVVAILVNYMGDIAEGERLAEPVRKFGSPVADTIGPMTYCELNSMLDEAFPYGTVQRYWKSSFLKDLGDEVIDILVDGASNMLSPMSMVGFFHVHGTAARVGAEETAFGLREDQWDYDIISQWTDPTETDMHIKWTRDFFNRMEPFASGVYVNHLGAEEADRIPEAYGTNYERLLALKNKYDPTNVFRLNQNIKPTV